ncbi:MAG: hypothetical protein OXF48_03550, partial [Bacteroidetes bacterium]|nr:hypothetical protein [Bacteroidota bacterium]
SSVAIFGTPTARHSLDNSSITHFLPSTIRLVRAFSVSSPTRLGRLYNTLALDLLSFEECKQYRCQLLPPVVIHIMVLSQLL